MSANCAMAPAARIRKYQALECGRRAAEARNPGVRAAYQRAAAQWQTMANDAKKPMAPRRDKRSRSAIRQG